MKGAVSFQWLVGLFVALTIAFGGWSITQMNAKVDSTRLEFRGEIEAFKRDRFADLGRLAGLESRISGLEVKIDALRETQIEIRNMLQTQRKLAR